MLSTNQEISITQNQNSDNREHRLPKQRTSSYKVTSRSEIVHLLSTLKNNHILLSIKVGESALDFGSMILDVHKNDAYIILDELFPRNNISEKVHDQNLNIECKIDGIHLRFTSKVNSVIRKDGSEYCKIVIPSSIYYFQRREFFRAITSPLNGMFIILIPEEGVTIQTEVKNLSLGGVSAQLDYESEILLKENNCPAFIINSPDGEKIHGSLEIIRMYASRQKHKSMLSGKFTELQSKDKHLLSKLVAKLERVNIKLIKRVHEMY